MKIGQRATATGIQVETVRFYERLAAAMGRASPVFPRRFALRKRQCRRNYRLYSDAQMTKLKKVHVRSSRTCQLGSAGRLILQEVLVSSQPQPGGAEVTSRSKSHANEARCFRLDEGTAHAGSA